MIQVTINNEPKQEEVKYPCLMRLRDTDDILIVLFTEPKRGIVLEDKKDTYQVYSIHNDWKSECFEPFNGQVTLQNQ